MHVQNWAVRTGLLVAAALCLLPAVARAQTTHDVSMQLSGPAFRFVPSSLTIKKGDIVRWTNNSVAVQHTTTSGVLCAPSGLWTSGLLSQGQFFSRQFNVVGSFDYFCIPHCLGQMWGLVIVEDSPPTGVEDPPAPARYHLFQNVPNPFSPETTIEYEIADPARVVIHVYDLEGRLVRLLENQSRGPGRYPARWDGRDANGSRLATGVYFYQMSLDGVAVDMKKMVLLR